MTDVTPGRPSSQARLTAVAVALSSVATLSTSSTISKITIGEREHPHALCFHVRTSAQSAIGRQLTTFSVLPGEHPATERTPHDDCHPVTSGGREYVALDVPPDERILWLQADKVSAPDAFGCPLRLDQLATVEIGAPDIADLS